ncbi:MAG: hypothetical protein KKC20_08740 [Proteobacteria bacterium]|nr:hypothetical protein [Pseudomonadota bacterium]
MPLARAAMHAKKETIHVAQWPSVIDLHQVASRHYAFEGQCFVLACGTTLSKKDVLEGFDSLNIRQPDARDMLDSVAASLDEPLMTGGSCVIGPDGQYLVQPENNTQKIIYATLDLNQIRESIMVMDTDGHYSRPSLIS